MSDKARYTTDAGEKRYSLYIYADAETKEALYRLATSRGQSQSQVVCDLIKEAAKGNWVAFMLKTLPSR